MVPSSVVSSPKRAAVPSKVSSSIVVGMSYSRRNAEQIAMERRKAAGAKPTQQRTARKHSKKSEQCNLRKIRSEVARHRARIIH